MLQKHDKSFLLSIEQAIFEKTKGVIRCGILKKDRQCNDQKKRGKRTKNYLQNTSQKTKVRATRTRLGVRSSALPASLVAPVMLLSLQTRVISHE